MRFAKHRPNVYTLKEGGTIILSVVLLLSPASCSGEAVFHCESETTLFGLPKEGAFYGGLFPEPGIEAYNAVLLKYFFYKVGQFQLCKDSLAFLTHSL